MVHPSSRDYKVVRRHSVSVDNSDGCRTEETGARHGGICGLVGICNLFFAWRLLVQ